MQIFLHSRLKETSPSITAEEPLLPLYLKSFHVAGSRLLLRLSDQKHIKSFHISEILDSLKIIRLKIFVNKQHQNDTRQHGGQTESLKHRNPAEPDKV